MMCEMMKVQIINPYHVLHFHLEMNNSTLRVENLGCNVAKCPKRAVFRCSTSTSFSHCDFSVTRLLLIG